VRGAPERRGAQALPAAAPVPYPRCMCATATLLLALAWPAAWFMAQEGEREQAAASELARAQERAADGHYADARRDYERIAERYAGTQAAVVARRRARPSAFVGWTDLVRHGPSSNRVDVVVMGEGYQLGEQDQLDDLAANVPDWFARQATLREYYPYFNFLRANLVSADNGVDGFGREYDTALGGHTLSTIAGHVGIDPAQVHAMLDELPEHDRLAIAFVKTGVLGTANAGIATVGSQSLPMLIHEWGHAFGLLGDEYATHTHERGLPSEHANVAVSADPQEAPWAHWIRARVPGVGMYEGAAGQVRDAWRPTASGCVMEQGEFFCRVCQEALVLAIYQRVDPIEDCAPPAPDSGAGLILGEKPLEFALRVMRPAGHDLEVSWWVLPKGHSPATGGAPAPGQRALRDQEGDRRIRGALAPIAAEPTGRTSPDGQGRHRLRLHPGDLEPGLYRVTVRARDTAQWRGERWPWVLKDEHGLLESERAWWLMVLARR